MASFIGFDPRSLSIPVSGILPQSVAPGTADTGGVDTLAPGLFFGWVNFVLSVGVFGGGSTVDAKVQESTDNATFTDLVPPLAINQLTPSGGNNKVVSVSVHRRQLTKRYVRLRVTVGVTATFISVASLAHSIGGSDVTAADSPSVLQRLLGSPRPPDGPLQGAPSAFIPLMLGGIPE